MAVVVAGRIRQLAFSCMNVDECLDVYRGPDVLALRRIGIRLIGGRSCCIRVEWNRSEFYGRGCINIEALVKGIVSLSVCVYVCV